jgi:hypothetical protein
MRWDKWNDVTVFVMTNQAFSTGAAQREGTPMCASEVVSVIANKETHLIRTHGTVSLRTFATDRTLYKYPDLLT